TSAREGLLVLADPWYPGWQARVNGDRTAVRRGGGAVPGVRGPAGTSAGVFTYRDAGMQLGALLAVLTALGLAAWALIVRPRLGGRRRRAGPRRGRPGGRGRPLWCAQRARVSAGARARRRRASSARLSASDSTRRTAPASSAGSPG